MNTTKKENKKQRCKHRHSQKEHPMCFWVIPENPKVLLLDIETSPALGWVWEKYETNVIEFEKQWKIICIGYKWLNSKTQIISGKEREIVRKIRNLLDEADLVIGHNGDRFDFKKINTRIAYFNLKPPSRYKTVDTLKAVKKYWGMLSNKLSDIGVYMNLGEKIDTGGFKLWKECMAGNKKAWKLMVRYCKQDVNLLEKIYKRLLPWLPEPKLYKRKQL